VVGNLGGGYHFLLMRAELQSTMWECGVMGRFLRIPCRCAGLLAVVWGCISVAAAESPVPPRISSLARLHQVATQSKPDEDDDEPAAPIPRDPAVEGRVLLGELNCVACHAAGEKLSPVISTKQAPVLDEVGSRVKLDWLRTGLADMHTAKPGTTMPDVFHGMSAEEKAVAVESLVHLLASTGRTTDVIRDAGSAARGKELFHKVGCVACHDPQEEDVTPLPTSVPLPNLSQKYSSTSLAAFLKETHKSRPSGRMPSFPLKDEQIRDLAQYLVKEVSIEPNVSFALYYGSWGMIPKFEELKAIHQSQCGGFDLAVSGRANDFGVRFQAQLLIKPAGKYTLHIGSDDGSRLLIDGKSIVDNDGIHPYSTKSGTADLAEGWHEIQIDFIQGGGEGVLTADIEGPGLPKQSLGGLVLHERKEPAAKSPEFVVLPELVEQGRKVFANLGCAACHTLHQNEQRVDGLRNGKPLGEVNVLAGCLAEMPPKTAPDYHLSISQRSDIVAALQTAPVETTAQTVHRQLLTFNCYACHQRDTWGGVEESRNAFFESLIKEMGDESRVPPTLTGVGDKLQPEWLKQVLEHSGDDRKNYMLVKMPKFGIANVGSLTPLLAEVDQQPAAETPAAFPEPEYRIKAAGRHLVGGAALSCIKCHDFREYPSTGIRALSLTTMTKRLREDWFTRYMFNPQVYRPGTRMPAPWPNGQASIKDVLDGDTPLQMRAVWTYLADGNKAAIPVGLIREPIELKPTTTPIIYRNFIERAGHRAIAVGYPEGLNLAFDANEFRLALIWHGAFLDASQHWNGRGQGTIDPLGDNVLDLGTGPSLARLTSANDSWPTPRPRESGYRFLGYALDKQQRPTFRYRLGEIMVEDCPEPFVKDGDKYPGLRRTLNLTANNSDAGDVWYRAAIANDIQDTGEGNYRIDDIWNIRLKSTEKPTIREMNGKKELLLPIKFVDGKATIVQDYLW